MTTTQCGKHQYCRLFENKIWFNCCSTTELFSTLPYGDKEDHMSASAGKYSK